MSRRIDVGPSARSSRHVSSRNRAVRPGQQAAPAEGTARNATRDSFELEAVAAPRSVMLAQRVLPAQAREPVEVRVRCDQSAAVLHRDCRVLGIGRQLAGCSRAAAEILEDLQVVRTRVDDASVGPADELSNEVEDLVVG